MGEESSEVDKAAYSELAISSSEEQRVEREKKRQKTAMTFNPRSFSEVSEFSRRLQRMITIQDKELPKSICMKKQVCAEKGGSVWNRF